MNKLVYTKMFLPDKVEPVWRVHLEVKTEDSFFVPIYAYGKTKEEAFLRITDDFVKHVTELNASAELIDRTTPSIDE